MRLYVSIDVLVWRKHGSGRCLINPALFAPRSRQTKTGSDQDPTQGRDHKERSAWYLYGTGLGCAVSGCDCSLLVHTVVQYRIYWRMFFWPEVEIEALPDSRCSLHCAVLYSHCAVRSRSYKERDMIDDRRPTAARRMGEQPRSAGDVGCSLFPTQPNEQSSHYGIIYTPFNVSRSTALLLRRRYRSVWGGCKEQPTIPMARVLSHGTACQGAFITAKSIPGSHHGTGRDRPATGTRCICDVSTG